MRSWHIIAASTVAAIAAGAFLFLSGALPWGTGVVALLVAHWPAIAVVLLSTYATVALALTTLAAFLEVGNDTRRRSWNDRVRPYFVQLGVTQYFTSMLALLALGLSRIPVETA